MVACWGTDLRVAGRNKCSHSLSPGLRHFKELYLELSNNAPMNQIPRLRVKLCRDESCALTEVISKQVVLGSRATLPKFNVFEI